VEQAAAVVCVGADLGDRCLAAVCVPLPADGDAAAPEPGEPADPGAEADKCAHPPPSLVRDERSKI